MLRMLMAVHKAQRRRRHNPNATELHARQTTDIRNTALCPIVTKPSRACGLSRQSVSSEVPGKINSTTVSPDARVPTTKKRERTTIPAGRLCWWLMCRGLSMLAAMDEIGRFQPSVARTRSKRGYLKWRITVPPSHMICEELYRSRARAPGDSAEFRRTRLLFAKKYWWWQRSDSTLPSSSNSFSLNKTLSSRKKGRSNKNLDVKRAPR